MNIGLGDPMYLVNECLETGGTDTLLTRACSRVSIFRSLGGPAAQTETIQRQDTCEMLQIIVHVRVDRRTAPL